MKNLIVIFFFFSFASAANSQNIHLNLFLGSSNYQGDLQAKRYTFNQSHLAGGLGLSYDLTNHFTIRGAYKLGKISGDDKYGRNSIRNLNFSSMLSEGDLDLQYYITPLGSHSLTPYVFAGIALFHFDPYTFDTAGRKFYLKPLSTEGEGFIAGRNNYSLTQFAVPFGAGIKMPLSDNLNVGVEVGFRKTFTDYLDDVSKTFVDENLLLAARGTKAVELSYRGDEIKGGSPVYPASGTARGNPGSKDWYYFTGITLSIRLGNGLLGNGNGSGAGKSSEWNCPKKVL
jgi:opacity protein-like surface antigen